ncbi:MAG: hypothetical protein M1812_003476 [Candelaria pacifica]|nr:MAG: hypothetical protein M1812_003476 [Candelaria pacifica]
MPQETYAPPPGQPPSHHEQYSASPEPTRCHEQSYAPPPGPPLSHQNQYAPPPGPPPSHDPAPAYHDWTVIPDTALLPPPPSMGHIQSPTSNSTLSEADRAHAWCASNPLFAPRNLAPTEIQALQHSNMSLLNPYEFSGTLSPLASPGTWKVRTKPGSKDCCLITSLPLFSVNNDSPLNTEIPKTLYFEMRILSQGPPSSESSISLGYLAAPYPTWRQPGWERGSLGIHGDDGRRYVNDTWGGKDFTAPFKVGQTVGIGMKFSIPEQPPEYSEQMGTIAPKLKVEVFFTRDGRRDEGWDLHEERDVIDDEGVEGLEGERDVYAAVGVFGEGEVEISFNSRDWLYQP